MINVETTYKDFTALQLQMRDELTCLLTVRDVRNVLSVSAHVVGRLIDEGELDAYDIFGDRQEQGRVNVKSNGLRISPESLHKFLQSKAIS